MNHHGRILAALAGAAFLAGGLAILLGHVLLTPSQWGQYHVLTMLMIGGTIAAGHLTKTAWFARTYLSFVGFLVLFVSGTALVVYDSVGRQAEQNDTIVMERATANALIKDKTHDIEAARERLANAEREADKQRGTKCKALCKGWEAAADDARNVIRVLESEVKALGAPKPLDAKADNAGKIAGIFGYDHDTIAALASLVVPFFKTLFFEFGAIVSFGFAFRLTPQQLPVSSFSKAPESGNSGGGKAERPSLRIVHEDHEVAALKKALQGGRALTNDELTVAMGLRSKGEASKRVTKGENLGLVRRERVGKHVRITLCHAH